MLEDGEVHPRSMSPLRLADPRTRSLAGRVVLTENPELTARYLLSESEQPGGEEGAIVEIEWADGSVLGPVKGINVLFPERLPGRETVEAKFRWAAADALDARADRRRIELGPGAAGPAKRRGPRAKPRGTARRRYLASARALAARPIDRSTGSEERGGHADHFACGQ